MNQPDYTLILPMNSGITIKLNSYNIISPVGTSHLVSAFDMRIPYFLQPWAREEFIKHHELLD